MRFDVPSRARSFAESVRGDRRLGAAARAGARGLAGRPRRRARRRVWQRGWSELWAGAARRGRRGSIELGRGGAASLVDEATLGAPLCVEGRRGTSSARRWRFRRRGGLALGRRRPRPRAEPTLDGTGTVRVDVGDRASSSPCRHACWRAWNAATLAYLAGLAGAALELAVEHARTREQFGAPLAALPAVQSRLADAALATDAMTLLAWAATERRRPPGRRAPLGGRGLLRGDRERASGARRDRVRARDRAARLPPARARATQLGPWPSATPSADVGGPGSIPAIVRLDLGERPASHSSATPPSGCRPRARFGTFEPPCAPVGSSRMRRNSSRTATSRRAHLRAARRLVRLEQPEEERAQRRVAADAPVGRCLA